MAELGGDLLGLLDALAIERVSRVQQPELVTAHVLEFVGPAAALREAV